MYFLMSLDTTCKLVLTTYFTKLKNIKFVYLFGLFALIDHIFYDVNEKTEFFGND